jgi:hypothetical protein
MIRRKVSTGTNRPCNAGICHVVPAPYYASHKVDRRIMKRRKMELHSLCSRHAAFKNELMRRTVHEIRMGR